MSDSDLFAFGIVAILVFFGVVAALYKDRYNKAMGISKVLLNLLVEMNLCSLFVCEACSEYHI